MVDSADLGFYGAAWRFADFCQQLYAGSVYLQFVLKSCELPGLFRALHICDSTTVGCAFVAHIATATGDRRARMTDVCSFDTVAVAAGVDGGLHRPNGVNGISDLPSPRLRRAEHRGQSDEGRSENGAGGDASNIDGQTERSKCAGAHESKRGQRASFNRGKGFPR